MLFRSHRERAKWRPIIRKLLPRQQRQQTKEQGEADECDGLKQLVRAIEREEWRLEKKQAEEQKNTERQNAARAPGIAAIFFEVHRCCPALVASLRLPIERVSAESFTVCAMSTALIRKLTNKT